MVIGVLKEPLGENRVVVLPEVVTALTGFGISVLVEKDAGALACAPDSLYESAGARIGTRSEVISGAGLILMINPPSAEDLSKMNEGKILISQLNPLIEINIVKQIAAAGITSFSLDVIPRTTRAQAMDILSSMATVNGYKAVLTAANSLPKFFPMFMTTAGTITPAKVLILGAGIAGLQAIATARRLGGVVEVFDVRAAVREEVIGLGAKFVEVEGATDDKGAGGYAVEQTDDFKKRQAQVIHEHAVKSDVIICTAQIPGKKAPVLITKETVYKMKEGSVIIDLAASTGGNCELTPNNDSHLYHGVRITGNSNFANDMPIDASKMYGKNILNFLKLMFNSKGEFNLNWDDDLVKGTCVTHAKEIVHERVKSMLNQ